MEEEAGSGRNGTYLSSKDLLDLDQETWERRTKSVRAAWRAARLVACLHACRQERAGRHHQGAALDSLHGALWLTTALPPAALKLQRLCCATQNWVALRRYAVHPAGPPSQPD